MTKASACADREEGVPSDYPSRIYLGRWGSGDLIFLLQQEVNISLICLVGFLLTPSRKMKTAQSHFK